MLKGDNAFEVALEDELDEANQQVGRYGTLTTIDEQISGWRESLKADSNTDFK